ncbi:uncharacterized protein V6R79_015227 [Siganus canaliculatus]
MLFPVCAIAVLCLVCVSHSAPLDCEALVRTSDHTDLGHLEGRWALIAGSVSYLPYLELFRQRDSASIHFSSNTSLTDIPYHRSLRIDGKCLHSSFNISLEGSSFTYDKTDKRNVSARFVHSSCHDCLLMHMDVESGKRQHFYLFSRRRQLEESELEEYRAQVECLKMPPPAVMDPTKELCPEERVSDPQTEETEKTQDN